VLKKIAMKQEQLKRAEKIRPARSRRRIAKKNAPPVREGHSVYGQKEIELELEFDSELESSRIGIPTALGSYLSRHWMTPCGDGCLH